MPRNLIRKRVTMAGNRARRIGGLLTAIALATAGCGSVAGGPGASVIISSTGSSSPPAMSPTPEGSLPPGVMSAAQACRQVTQRAGRGFFTRVERVHLVLTTYAKGEPVESRGDISTGMPPGTLVWVVEVHAKAINWDHSVPAGYHPPARPYTDYSVVMNARTGLVTDQGECRCWPLPLSKVGTVVSLPPEC
jgi:hypothetical protein